MVGNEYSKNCFCFVSISIIIYSLLKWIKEDSFLKLKPFRKKMNGSMFSNQKWIIILNKCLSSLTFQTDDGNNINGLIVIDDDTIVTFGNIYIIYIDINIIIYSITINTSTPPKTHQFQKKQKYFHWALVTVQPRMYV